MSCHLLFHTILAIPSLPDIFITLGRDANSGFVIDFFSDDKVIIIGWFISWPLMFLRADMLESYGFLDKSIFVSTPTLILGMMVAPLGFLIGMLLTEYDNTAI